MDWTKTSKAQIDKKQARNKMESYCAYQERSQQEVRHKLFSLGLHGSDVEEIIADLIQANFLNEERFAKAYALGKLRIKRWGKLKIKQGLKLKQVPEKLISKALNELDAHEYYAALTALLEKKALSLNEQDSFKKQYKLCNYAAGKGFEKDLIIDILKNKHLT